MSIIQSLTLVELVLSSVNMTNNIHIITIYMRIKLNKITTEKCLGHLRRKADQAPPSC